MSNPSQLYNGVGHKAKMYISVENALKLCQANTVHVHILGMRMKRIKGSQKQLHPCEYTII